MTSLPRTCLCPRGLANRPQPDWQGRAVLIPRRVAESVPLPRARVSTPFVRAQLMAGRSRALRSRRLRYRRRAGSTALTRTLGCSDRAWLDRNRLGAGDSAASLLRAGGSAFAPYRRALTAAFIGGITVGAARHSPTAAASVCQEGA